MNTTDVYCFKKNNQNVLLHITNELQQNCCTMIKMLLSKKDSSYHLPPVIHIDSSLISWCPFSWSAMWGRQRLWQEVHMLETHWWQLQQSGLPSGTLKNKTINNQELAKLVQHRQALLNTRLKINPRLQIVTQNNRSCHQLIVKTAEPTSLAEIFRSRYKSLSFIIHVYINKTVLIMFMFLLAECASIHILQCVFLLFFSFFSLLWRHFFLMQKVCGNVYLITWNLTFKLIVKSSQSYFLKLSCWVRFCISGVHLGVVFDSEQHTGSQICNTLHIDGKVWSGLVNRFTNT